MTPYWLWSCLLPLYLILAADYRKGYALRPHEPLKAKRPPAPKPSRHRTYNWH